MRWIRIAIGTLLFSSASFVASSTSPLQTPPPPVTEEDPDFVPTEDLPAGAAITFPVDI